MWAVVIDTLYMAVVSLFLGSTGDIAFAGAAGLCIMEAVASGALQRPLLGAGGP